MYVSTSLSLLFVCLFEGLHQVEAAAEVNPGAAQVQGGPAARQS